MHLNYRNASENIQESSFSEPLCSDAWNLICKHCLLVFHQVRSNESRKVHNGLAPESPSLNRRDTYDDKYLKIFFRTTWLRCLKLGLPHCPAVLYHIYSNDVFRVQNGPTQGSQLLKIWFQT